MLKIESLTFGDTMMVLYSTKKNKHAHTKIQNNFPAVSCYSCLMPHIDRNVLKFCKLTAGKTV